MKPKSPFSWVGFKKKKTSPVMLVLSGSQAFPRFTSLIDPNRTCSMTP